MDKELVKVGMKVKLVQFSWGNYLISICNQKKLDPVFVVLDPIGDSLFDKYRIESRKGEDFLSFEIDCQFFEPYEEPKEGNGTYSTSDHLEIAWLKRMCAENKEEREEAESDLREILNLPKEEATTYQVKDLEGNVTEEKVVEDKPSKIEDLIPIQEKAEHYWRKINCALHSEDHLPITQEFIESFGFVKSSNVPTRGVSVSYKKSILNVGFMKLEFNDDATYSLWLFSDVTEIACAIKYTCTTQSELRFLLTKGRIDCSK